LATQVNNASMRRWRRCDATSYCRCIQARGDTPSLAQIPEALDAIYARLASSPSMTVEFAEELARLDALAAGFGASARSYLGGSVSGRSFTRS
jgi:hypothetical protein